MDTALPLELALPALSALAALAAGLLAMLVLLQAPRGGGLAGALGGPLGASAEAAFGTAEAPVRRLTAGVAGVWMTACLAHAVLL